MRVVYRLANNSGIDFSRIFASNFAIKEESFKLISKC